MHSFHFILAALCGHGSRAGKEFDVTEETAKKFDQWYLQQVFNHYRRIATLAAAQAHHHQQAAAAAVAVAAAATQQQIPTNRGTNIHPLLSIDLDQHHTQLNQSSNPPNQLHDQHNALNSTSPQQEQQQFVRTRIRTSFDPELELPKLHKWFAENQHPSRAQIQQYVKELNALDSRKGRKLLDVNNVVYWFKNARAAHKRQELKFVNGSHSPPVNNNGGNQFSVNSAQEMSDNKNARDSSESNCKDSQEENGHNEDGNDSGDHEDSSAEAMDDDSSQMSQTLDLSVRPMKRRKSESLSPCSPNAAMATGLDRVRCNSFHLKDEQTDEDEDLNYVDENEYYSENAAINSEGSSFSTAIVNGSKLYSNNGSSILPHPDSPEEGRRIRRSRTFIDPMTEVPRLEQWFSVNTHPTHSQIVKYTEELNNLPYRQKFPKLEPKNIQFWFKNRRAKYKRLSLPSQIHQPSLAITCGPPSTSPNSIPSSSQTIGKTTTTSLNE
ncbi:hypothetical protein B4U79_04491 [Dinothrombium tinctorium]|uniref:Homeobox domain-containing protein n=1 Tax=Dinothrombium tinctorium TaxID=1965070 RepID=A0A3S3SM50_9ACAR|nr:hypothetical protein B4U79_04491 [Dinothrombium tinctorium]